MDFEKATRYIYSFIPKTDMSRFPGEAGMERMRILLQKLGNPQLRYKVIHIAGTSGKGSTATVAAALLRAAGRTVGLHVKPHISDIRERMQVNGELISEESFVHHVTSVVASAKEVEQEGYGHPTYYEVVLCLALCAFAEAGVEYAVLETGVGGLYDGTNVVTAADKIAIITRIGFDHVQILGNTLVEIATQKAGILHAGNVAFTVRQEPEVALTIRNAADERDVDLRLVSEEQDYGRSRIEDGAMVFDFRYHDIAYSDLRLGLIGDYQIENAAVALAAVNYAATRDGFVLTEDAVRGALRDVRFPGRFEIQTIRGKTVILDGAHNPQKMRAFLDTLAKVYPDRTFSFLVGFKKGKDVDTMLEMLIPLANTITVTDFFNDQADFVSVAAEPEEVAGMLDGMGFTRYNRVYSARHVMDDIISAAGDILVITGSLYLIGELYPSLERLRH
jgi:dihydrofolate synthase/folylpolyglutamate synthase